MRKAALPEPERKVCRRLKYLREYFGLSESAIAAVVGISRDQWHNYEMLRAPVRCELALNICRHFIVSEEWLATGAFALSERAAASRGIISDETLRKIYLRNLVDLRSEPEAMGSTLSLPFSHAFDGALAAKYGLLIQEHFHLPRLIPIETDRDDLFVRYLGVISERWLKLLRNDALRMGKDQGLARRSFLRAHIEAGTAIFKRFMGFKTPEIMESRYDFLRAIANDTEAPIGPIHGITSPSKRNRTQTIARHRTPMRSKAK